MNIRDEFKIELISNIDEEIIEKESVKRYSLILKNRYSRKKIAGWCSVAACLVLTVSIVLAMLSPLLTRQAPVYEGMTVSNTMPELKVGTGGSSLIISPEVSMPVFASGIDDGENVDDGDENGENSDTGTTEGESRITLPEVDGEDRLLYYARKNQDIYITVHINNPASYEILSFTLNGTKYQSYMFEDGSNSEALVLKVNVGDAEGIVEYTIDAIKYVDGTEIKDVRMDGERTVKVGVYSEDPEDHPSALITDKTLDIDSITFTPTVTDPNGAVDASNGAVFAYLYRGEEQIASRELTIGESTAVTFEGLEQRVEYRYLIVAYYDSFDGRGFAAHTIYEESFYTLNLVEIENLTLDGGSTIAFELMVTDGYSVRIEKIDLIDDFDLVAREGDALTRCFGSLTLGSYTVRVSYSYGEGNAVLAALYSESIKVSTFGSLGATVEGAHIVPERHYSTDNYYYDPTMNDWRAHYGIDVVTPGEAVYSTVAGKVYDISYAGGKVTLYTYNAVKDENEILIEYTDLAVISEELMFDGEVAVGDLVGYKPKAGNVYAAFTGIVKEVGEGTVIITDLSGEIELVYRSLGGISEELAVGEVVRQGELIGMTSSTYANEVVQPDHVHIEVRIAGERVDPMDYFEQ